MSRVLTIFGVVILLIGWGAAALLFDLPAPSTNQGLAVFPYTIVFTLLFIPKVAIVGVLSLL